MTLIAAEQVATRVFREAKVNVAWINCATAILASQNPASCRKAIFPNYLQLRIAARPLTLSDAAFGVSYVSTEGVGCYSNVFFERVEELHRTFNERSEVILGHLMAHEIAHLLLGTNVHSVSGISVVRIGIGVNWPAPTEVGCYSMGRNQNHETKSILRVGNEEKWRGDNASIGASMGEVS